MTIFARGALTKLDKNVVKLWQAGWKMDLKFFLE